MLCVFGDIAYNTDKQNSLNNNLMKACFKMMNNAPFENPIEYVARRIDIHLLNDI